MRLKARLKHWQKENLIDETQVKNILDFEKKRVGKASGLGVQLLGILSILLGISSVIAANWQEIGPYTKLVAHFILNAGLSVWLFKLNNKEDDDAEDGKRTFLKEGLTLGIFGLNLTFIALIGQIFHLKGTTTHALILWTILSAPLIICYAKSRFTAWVWFLSVIGTAWSAYNLFILKSDLSDFTQASLGLFFMLFVPLAFYADHALGLTQKTRREFAHVFRHGSLKILVVMASLAGFGFYGMASRVYADAGNIVNYYGIIGLIAAATYGYIFSLRNLLQSHDEPLDWYILLICVTAIFIPCILPVNADFFGAVLFCGLWLALGAVWQQAGEMRLVNLAITIVALRLYIVFLELFGDLMSSGIGLIIAGIVLIAMIKYTRKLQQKVAEFSQKRIKG